MPMKKGHSKEVVSENIKEMISSGRPRRQAVAAALASARKSKKMAEGGYVQGVPGGGSGTQGATPPKGAIVHHGKPPKDALPGVYYDNMAHGGMVSEDMDEGLGTTNADDAERSLNQIRIEGEYHPASVANPEHQDHDRMLAKALYKKGEDEEMLSYAMGGLVQPEDGQPLGNKPSEDMTSSTEEPMSEEDGDQAELGHSVIEGVPPGPGLSSEAMKALEEKKKRRRFS